MRISRPLSTTFFDSPKKHTTFTAHLLQCHIHLPLLLCNTPQLQLRYNQRRYSFHITSLGTIGDDDENDDNNAVHDSAMTISQDTRKREPTTKDLHSGRRHSFRTQWAPIRRCAPRCTLAGGKRSYIRGRLIINQDRVPAARASGPPATRTSQNEQTIALLCIASGSSLAPRPLHSQRRFFTVVYSAHESAL